MDSAITPNEVSLEVFPLLCIYADCTVLHLEGTEVTPPGLDPFTSVLSKDIPIPTLTSPSPSPPASICLPPSYPPHLQDSLILFFHGGAFTISSPNDPNYHNSINSKSLFLSLDYRLCPEHPVPATYDDTWSFLLWILGQSMPNALGHDPLL